MSKTEFEEYFDNPNDTILDLFNKPEYFKYCEITIFEDGKILLNWLGKEYGCENSFFLTLRAAKMYVTKMIGYKSIWKQNGTDTKMDN